MKTISVVIATYNGSLYVTKQLESILNQTYKDYHINIVDDCSSDSTVTDIVDVFSQRNFGDFQLYINDHNMGVNKSFQKGISNSNGKYIAFSDQDDIWFPKKLEISLKVIESTNADMVFSPSLILKDSKILGLYSRYRNFTKIFNTLMYNNARGATILIKREFADRVMPFSLHGLYDKWIYFLATLYGTFFYIPEALQYYRIHKSNYTGIGNRFKFKSKAELSRNYVDSIAFYDDLLRLLKKDYNINTRYDYEEVIAEIGKIQQFYFYLRSCLDDKNVFQCFKKYYEYVWKNDFSGRERLLFINSFFFKSLW